VAVKLIFWLCVVCLLLGAPLTRARGQEISIDDAVQLGQQFIDDNVDPDVLKALDQLDLGEAREFFSSLETKLNGEYVIDVAQLKSTAKKIIPVLQAHEETSPYAAWLQAKLDYFDAADRLRAMVSTNKPGEPPKEMVKPTQTQEKKIWVKMIEDRPIPPAAQPYVSKLKPVFAAEGMPEELVWLAEVESGFNPKARSPVGAAGLYQLMPNTAKSMGLSTFWPDERLKPEKVTPVAARLLRRLYGQFKDWRLTLAAYNAGEGRVQEAMRKHKASTFEAVSPWLPAETQMYVPRFEAVLQKREGMTLSQLPAPKKVQAK
jgi:membrane-bound lytic murein transglycosylase D